MVNLTDQRGAPGRPKSPEHRAAIAKALARNTAEHHIVDYATAVRYFYDLAGRAALTDMEREVLLLAAERALATSPPESRLLWERYVEALREGLTIRVKAFPAEFIISETARLEAELESSPVIRDLFAHLQQHDEPE